MEVVGSPGLDEGLLDALAIILADEKLEPAFIAEALTLPSEADVAREIGRDIDPDMIFRARAAQDVIDPASGDVIVANGNEIMEADVERIPVIADGELVLCLAEVRGADGELQHAGVEGEPDAVRLVRGDDRHALQRADQRLAVDDRVLVVVLRDDLFVARIRTFNQARIDRRKRRPVAVYGGLYAPD